MDFYEHIAHDYDAMTGLDRRTDRIKTFVQTLIHRYHPQSALDVACGTGIYAVTMAQQNIQVTAADLSPAMLDQARNLAQQNQVTCQWLSCPMQQLTRHLHQTFDLILCLGNSLPHLLTPDDLNQTIAAFAQLLRPGGTALIHLLNYHRLLADQNRIVALTRRDQQEFIRFYDFLDPLVRFNLLQINWHTTPPQHQLSSTTLFPYPAQTVSAALQKHNFNPITHHGNLDFTPYHPHTSPALLIEAHHPS